MSLTALELFAGTQSVGKVLKSHGMKVISLDIFDEYKPTIQADILEWEGYKDLPKIDFFWASPPCNSFSRLAVANKSRDWYTLKPLKPNAVLGNKILYRTLDILEYLLKKNPNMLFVIENPHSMMTRMPIINRFEKEITLYCLYGFQWAKKTDFFHNFPQGLNLKDPETSQPCDTAKLVNVANVSLQERYKIPSGIIQQIYREFKRQYKSEKPKSTSFTRTEAMTLPRPRE
jgi:site-specific DNA-cytosine methylase